jgi:hypothetical protein
MIEVPRHLLRERARTLSAPPFDDVGEDSGRDAEDVDPEMPIELCIFGRDDRLAKDRIDIVVADDDTALRRELADDFPVRRVDARDRARRVIVERRDLRQVADVGEEDAGADAQHRDQDEEGGDAGVARDSDDDVFHG